MGEGYSTNSATQPTDTITYLRMTLHHPTSAIEKTRSLRSIREARDFAICTALVCALVAGLQWLIIDAITVILFLYLVLGVVGLFVISAWWSASVCWLQFSKLGRKATYPAVINIATALAVVFFPFTRIWLEFDYWLYRADRFAIVDAIHQGDLLPNIDHNRHLIRLQDSAPTVSRGGNEVVIQAHDNGYFVFFFTYRGILDNYSGFLYTPKGAGVGDYARLRGETFVEAIEMEHQWHFVVNK